MRVATANYTAEMFTTDLARHCQGQVLTLAQVEQRRGTVVSHNFVGKDQNVMFFSNNHLFGYPRLPDCCVPCTTSIPRKVAPRPGFENGVIATAADEVRFERHCNPKLRIIETLDELVEYLNANH